MSFFKANPRCEILFFSSVDISPKVLSGTSSGIKIGSNPNPLFPRIFSETLPSTLPAKKKI